ncbi:MAG: GTPase Era [Bdellovibrionaceae bacterium]|nr:GTPase Era [Pseudobdellovibrionaceae bacterium]
MKAGFLGLIGLPNSGKSTLVNALVGEKVSIVTAKPQTTRQNVLGILNVPNAQIIFVDTPGEVKAQDGINKYLQQEFEKSLDESDALIAILNMDAPNSDSLQRILDMVKDSKKPWLPLITKTDLPQSFRLIKLQEMVEAAGKPFITANYNRSTESLREDMLAEFIKILPESPAPLYDPELYTTQTMREMTQEVVREKCFEALRDEVPYGLAVDIRKYEENEQPTIHIHADLILNKESHKPMVVGSRGQRIKHIGTMARKDLEKILGRPVFLQLFVKVKKNWTKNSLTMKELGYVLDL